MIRKDLLFEHPPIAPQMETSARTRPMTIKKIGNDVIVGRLSSLMTPLSVSVAMPIEKITIPMT